MKHETNSTDAGKTLILFEMNTHTKTKQNNNKNTAILSSLL